MSQSCWPRDFMPASHWLPFHFPFTSACQQPADTMCTAAGIGAWAGQPSRQCTAGAIWQQLMANKAAQAMLGWPEAYVPVPALAPRPVVTVRKNLL